MPLQEANLEGLQGVIITDCKDENAQARQKVRFHKLFGVTPTLIGLGEDDPDLEAAGHLVDVLDDETLPEKYAGSPTVVLVNVAPRGDDVRQKWENGTPFCRVEVGSATIVSTYEGRALSLVNKLGLVATADLFNIPEVTDSLVRDGTLTGRQAITINNSQFRSRDFLPLAAREIVGGKILPTETLEIPRHPLVDGRAWFVDNFNNVKTTLLPQDVDFQEGETRQLANSKDIACYRRLADVPTGQFGLTVGSSGYGEHRWLEVVKQCGRAAEDLDIKIGSQILKAA